MNKRTIIIIALGGFLLIALLLLLINQTKKITIEINPQNASLFVDEARLNENYNGTYILNLKTGKHKIKALSLGFSPYENNIKIYFWSSKKITIEMERGVRLVDGLPYSDNNNNFFIYGYYDDDYFPTYKISLFNNGAKELANNYLIGRGVDIKTVKLLYVDEWDTGEAAPN